MIFMVILIAVAAFSFGFLLGCINEPPARPVKTNIGEIKSRAVLEQLNKEYENFLNYDGSEQA